METELRCFQRLASQASERYVKKKRCGCWGYHQSLFLFFPIFSGDSSSQLFCCEFVISVIPQQQIFAMGSLAVCGFGGFRCRYLVRFRRVPVQIPCEVPEVSGAGTRRFYRGFWCRYLVGSGSSFWCSYLMRFRRVPGQIPL